MKSRLHPDFRKCFSRLPKEMQKRAREAYERFTQDPGHPSLQFKPLSVSQPLWSVRISQNYRAVGVRTRDDEIIWFFIGTHAEYDRLLSQL